VTRAGRAASASLALAALAAAAALVAPPARADGDPASDYLLLQNVYFPEQPPSQSAETALEQAASAVYANGDRIKVAVIGSIEDLGAIPSLWGKPADYAHFLGAELALWYVGPLLVAMPAGFGVYDGGRSTAAEQEVLDAAPLSSSGSDQLTRSAATAVQHLEAAGALRSPDVHPPLATAYPATAEPGKTATLHVDLFDDSGRSKATVRVYEAGTLVATLTAPMTFAIGTRHALVHWDVPRKLRSRQLRFCVVAADPSGNRSKPACAPFLRVG